MIIHILAFLKVFALLTGLLESTVSIASEIKKKPSFTLRPECTLTVGKYSDGELFTQWKRTYLPVLHAGKGSSTFVYPIEDPVHSTEKIMISLSRDGISDSDISNRAHYSFSIGRIVAFPFQNAVQNGRLAVVPLERKFGFYPIFPEAVVTNENLPHLNPAYAWTVKGLTSTSWSIGFDSDRQTIHSSYFDLIGNHSYQNEVPPAVEIRYSKYPDDSFYKKRTEVSFRCEDLQPEFDSDASFEEILPGFVLETQCEVESYEIQKNVVVKKTLLKSDPIHLSPQGTTSLSLSLSRFGQDKLEQKRKGERVILALSEGLGTEDGVKDFVFTLARVLDFSHLTHVVDGTPWMGTIVDSSIASSDQLPGLDSKQIYRVKGLTSTALSLSFSQKEGSQAARSTFLTSTYFDLLRKQTFRNQLPAVVQIQYAKYLNPKNPKDRTEVSVSCHSFRLRTPSSGQVLNSIKWNKCEYSCERLGGPIKVKHTFKFDYREKSEMSKKKMMDEDGWVFVGSIGGTQVDVGMLAGESGGVHFYPVRQLKIPEIQLAEDEYLWKKISSPIYDDKFNTVSEASREFFFDQNLTMKIPLEQLAQFQGEAWVKYSWKKNSLHSVIADRSYIYEAPKSWIEHFSEDLAKYHNSTRHRIDPSHPCIYNVAYVVDGIRVVTDGLVMTSSSSDERLSFSSNITLGVNGITAENFSLSEALRLGYISVGSVKTSYKAVGERVMFYHLRPVNWKFGWNSRHLFKPVLAESPVGDEPQRAAPSAEVPRNSDSDQECFEVTDSSKLL